MAKLLPSLDERLQQIIEECCGGTAGMDMGAGVGDAGEPPTADSESNSLINRTLDKLKTKRKSRKANGT